MHFLGELKNDRKLPAAILAGLLAVLLGFVVISDETGLRLVIYGGYWVMLVTTALFVWALWRSLQPLKDKMPATPRERWIWLGVAFAVCLLLDHER